MHSISSLVSIAERMMLCRCTLLRETPALQLQVVHLKEVMPAALDFDPSDLLACHSHEKCCLPRSSTASSDVRGVPMSAEQNKAVVRHVLDEVWNAHNLAKCDELYVADYVDHDPSTPPTNTLAEFKKSTQATLAAFPDLYVTVEAMIAEGDLVAKRYTMTGTQQGEFMGVPPSGRPVTMTGITIYRIKDGKVAECWWNYDALGLMMQIGAIPTP